MIGRAVLLGGAALLTLAAAPSFAFIPAPVVPPILSVRPQTLPKSSGLSGFAPAPLPDRDALEPQTRASGDPSVSPSLFTRRDQYRGEALNATDSAQTTQERRVTPGAGFSLSVPLH